MAYLDVAGFTFRTPMPSADVAVIVQIEPLFLVEKLEDVTDEINSQLRKRYAVPFAAPYPRIVMRWLEMLVTPEAYEKRGWNPSDEQAKTIIARAELARSQLKEAANAETGLFDLPLRSDAQQSAVSKGGPFGYSEASPYVWTNVQREAAAFEDENGRGT